MVDLPLEQASTVTSNPQATKNKLSMVVCSGDMDKVMAAYIIATGASASGMEVTMFFTFWGLKSNPKTGCAHREGSFWPHARPDEPWGSGCDWPQPVEYGRNGTLDVQINDEAKRCFDFA